jgi:hypothetical protein
VPADDRITTCATGLPATSRTGKTLPDVLGSAMSGSIEERSISSVT